MYYITNHNDQIIAADESLLELLHVEDVDNLVKKILLEEVSFNNKSSSKLKITTSTDTYFYTIHRTSLSSMLGSLNLIHLEIKEEQALDNEEMQTDIKAASILNSDNLSLPDENENKKLSKSELQDAHEDRLYDLSLSDEEISSSDIDTIISEEKDDSQYLDLTLPETATDRLDEITLDIDTQESLSLGSEETVNKDESLDAEPIIIDIQKVSEEIGISNDDYKTFLNDYINTAISLEDELQSTNENERLSAINTLTQLADVLQLPKINHIIQEIERSPQDKLSDKVELFYQTLSRLTTKEEDLDSSTEISFETLSDINKSEDAPLETEVTKTSSEKGFGKIYLEDVKPIHFDFQLEAAANDLSLPVELIEEFVHDFIEQCHEETKKMLQAYEDGDLETIQKIGHLLKGAASNLRINALSDTLYDIQFCEDSDKLEDYIERYWAHFLSFEQQIDMITKH
jgi:HPt (histidine-containing phosphotransfer) domain-containing protein